MGRVSKKARLYELSGSLKSEWRNIVDVMKVDRKTITSKGLLEHYEATVVKDTALARRQQSQKRKHSQKVADCYIDRLFRALRQRVRTVARKSVASFR